MKKEPSILLGLKNNFNKEINYEFVADLKKWNTQNGKPENDKKMKFIRLFIYICKENHGPLHFVSIENIKLFCVEKELIKSDNSKMLSGEAQYIVKELETVQMVYFFD